MIRLNESSRLNVTMAKMIEGFVDSSFHVVREIFLLVKHHTQSSDPFVGANSNTKSYLLQFNK